MNRREFLMGTAAFAAAGRTTANAAEAVTRWHPFPEMKKVRVVQWGIRHEHASGKFDSLRKLPNDFELVGIVDDGDSKTLAEVNGTKMYDGIPRLKPEQVWADKSIQCVFVEVTNDDLCDVAWQCARHGVAFHMDKPAGQDFAKYEALERFCQARGIPLQMGYMFRVNPAIRFCQKIVRDGWLGDIISIEADMHHDYGSAGYDRYIASFKGGIMYNLGCHLVDFILPMMPGMPTRAHVIQLDAPGSAPGSKTNCVSVLEWPHGTATLRTSRHAACASRLLRIMGTRGAVDLRPIERFDGQPLRLELRLKHPAGTYKAGWHTIPFGPQKDRYADQLKELADIIRGRIPNPDLYDHDIAVHKVVLMASGAR